MRWDSIEALRKAIVLVVQGEVWIDLETSEGANDLAEAIERCIDCRKPTSSSTRVWKLRVINRILPSKRLWQ